ncbi:MarR family winged helix-turn-helix transcriptional regulator [uncultured Sphingomonas sp.]|uniref:MarR family winged helix-turn-helix transcriptional regulator n=1 Tax=uncultured Sphingomonas sp. TaxID=158754 RepID=UPI0035CC28C0
MMRDERPLGEVLNRTARLLRRLADQRLAPFALSAGYLPVLTALMRGEAMSQRALTEQAGIEQPTMAATLVRMERDGAIERKPDPGDKRSVLYTLSAQTRSRASEIEAAIQQLNGDALDGVSRADRERLHDMLAAIAGSVEQQLRRST